MPEANAQSRLHIVLVPGFGGFDALGQIEYYPGTNAVAERWRAEDATGAEGRARVVMHYFDNLPTAGVRTRAERLKRFLMKRCDRNDFQPTDKIALIGHSTGGLDIRQLLLLLADEVPTEGVNLEIDEHERELSERLRGMIRRVVFMSVPQRGTNIADWARAISLGRRLAVWLLSEATDVVDLLPLEGVQALIAEKLTGLRNKLPAWLSKTIDAGVPDVMAALADVVSEVEARGSSDPVRAAAGREALSDLSLWLGHTHGDFLAIDDLCCEPAKEPVRPLRMRFGLSAEAISQHDDVTSLARKSAGARAEELAYWKSLEIEVLSFATRAKPPGAHFVDSDRIQSYLTLAHLFGVPFVGETDGLFRAVYHACATGPFAAVRARIEASEPDCQAGATRFPEGGSVPADEIASWNNDGIVNTASMLWPSGSATLLVEADHGDIVGHYEQNRPRTEGLRVYRSYDIFGSGSRFDDDRFEQVWRRAFDHCLSALHERSRTP